MRATFLFSRFTFIAALLAALIGSAVQVTPAHAASIVVNSNLDNRLNDGKCTLREAIIAATINAPSGSAPGECAGGSSAGVDSISFAGNYTITVGSQLPFITTPITITGRGATNTIIQAHASPNVATWRVLQVTPTGSLTLDGVTVQHGRCNGSCTAVGDVWPDSGGGIYNTGTLMVKNSVISGNIADSGGGIVNWESLTVINSTISGNTANGTFGWGGGIYSDNPLTVTNSTISGNTAVYGGGGIFTQWVANITSSTFSGNSTTEGNGGGIYNTGLVNLSNSTFSGNSAPFGEGGGLYNYATSNLTITNSTFAGNSASSGGGINLFNQSGVTPLKNTLLANNNGGNCAGTGIPGNVGNNLDSGATCGFGFDNGSLSNTNPMLSPLAGNGGPTQTMALQASSPAIDRGNAGICSAAPVSGVDQRGLSRPQGAGCDIGAYEFNGTFWDASPNYWAWSFIESIYSAGITGGCGVNPLQYCPEATVTRAQMAVFLLRGIHGSAYNPPAVGSSTGFADVSTGYWAAAWIKQLAAEGITGGCGSGSYCPESAVTRAQMAVFLLRSKYGAGYNPPGVGGGTGFTDVPSTYWAAAWIKQLVAEAITAGCSAGSYCPESPVTRAQMAVFLVRTFGLAAP